MCHLILFLPAFGLPLFWVLPFSAALPSYLLIVGISLFLYFKIFQAMRREIQTGPEAMLGKKGLVVVDLDPEGKIQFASQVWDARSRGKTIVKGEQVIITGIRGLMLLVE